MRVVLASVYDTLGGSTRVLLATAAALRPAHAVRVRAPLETADDRAPALFSARPLVGGAAKLAALPGVARLVLQEAAYLREVRPDVVWVHDEPSLYVYGLVVRALRPRPRVVWHLHAGAGGPVARAIRQSLADRIVSVSRHAAAGLSAPATVLRNPVAMPRRAEPQVPAEPLGAGSTFPLPLAGRGRGGGGAEGTARPDAARPPPPTPPRRGEERARIDPKRSGENGSTLAVVGALSRRKNPGLPIEALARLGDDARLTLVGPAIDPAYAAELRVRAGALGLADRVAFAGPRTPEAVWEAAPGIALFPSLDENQPLALVEAILAGRALVATDIPGHREIFHDLGIDFALLVPAEPEAFARAIRIARAPEPAVIARARELFAPERFAEGARAVVASLTSGRSP